MASLGQRNAVADPVFQFAGWGSGPGARGSRRLSAPDVGDDDASRAWREMNAKGRRRQYLYCRSNGTSSAENRCRTACRSLVELLSTASRNPEACTGRLARGGRRGDRPGGGGAMARRSLRKSVIEVAPGEDAAGGACASIQAGSAVYRALMKRQLSPLRHDDQAQAGAEQPIRLLPASQPREAGESHGD